MNNKTKIFYNRFCRLYPVVDVLLKGQKNLLFKELNSLPHGKLLEIGVGTGSHLRRFKRHSITGIDTSSSMLKKARRQNTPGAELLQMDGMALLFDKEQFDYVVLSHVIAVVDDPEKLMEEVLRVLKPGGTVYILNHFTPRNWLRHIDSAFSLASKLFHFESNFHVEQITTLKKFTLLKEISLGTLSYFKLIIYQKK